MPGACALQDLLHALVCLAAPPGKLWLQNQTPEQKRKCDIPP